MEYQGHTYHNAADGWLTARDDDDAPESLTYQIVRSPRYGTVVLDAQSGYYIYSAGPNFSGGDAFNFVVNDGIEDSEAAAVVISEYPGPGARNQIYCIGKNSVWSSYKPVEIIRHPAHGTVTMDEMLEYVYHYTPDPDYVGYDSFEAVFYSSSIRTRPVATVEFHVSEDPSSCEHLGFLPGCSFFGVLATEPTTITNSQTGFIPDDAPPSVTVVKQDEPEHGTVELTPYGTFTYTLTDPDYRGWDFFSFKYQGVNANMAANWVTVSVGYVPPGSPRPLEEVPPEELSADSLADLKRAYDDAMAALKPVGIRLARLGSVMKLIDAAADPSDALLQDAEGIQESVTKAYDNYVKYATRATDLAAEFLRRDWYLTQAEADVLGAIQKLPITVAGIRPTEEQLEKWRAALSNLGKAAGFAVDYYSHAIEIARTTHDVLQTATVALGVGSIVYTGTELLATDMARSWLTTWNMTRTSLWCW